MSFVFSDTHAFDLDFTTRWDVSGVQNMTDIVTSQKLCIINTEVGVVDEKKLRDHQKAAPDGKSARGWGLREAVDSLTENRRGLCDSVR